MAALKLLSLVVLVVLVALSSGPLPINALVADRAEVARHAHAHDAIARRKRSDSSTPSSSGRCKPRPSSSPLPTSTPAPLPPTSTTPLAPSTTSAAPSPTSTGSGGGKYGLAFSTDPGYLANFNRDKVQFIYTWSPYKPAGVDLSPLMFIPMLWGWDQVQPFAELVVSGYATYAAGPNEPNIPTQSNLTPLEAVDLWTTYLDPLVNEGYTLISPACTNDDSGWEWYEQFFAACTTCNIHYTAVHCYTTSADDCMAFATALYGNFSRPIMITEFADQNFSNSSQASMDQVWDFAGAMDAFIENTEWVAAGIPFGVVSDLQGVNTDNALMTSDGNATSLAQFYFGDLRVE